MSEAGSKWYAEILDRATSEADAAVRSDAGWVQVRRSIDEAGVTLAEIAAGVRAVPGNAIVTRRDVAYGVQFGRAYLTALRRQMRDRVTGEPLL